MGVRARAAVSQFRRRVNPRKVVRVSSFEVESHRFGPDCNLGDDHPRLTYPRGKLYQVGESSVFVLRGPLNWEPAKAHPQQKLAARHTSSLDGKGVDCP